MVVLTQSEKEEGGEDWVKEWVGGLALISQTFSTSVLWSLSASLQASFVFP